MADPQVGDGEPVAELGKAEPEDEIGILDTLRRAHGVPPLISPLRASANLRKVFDHRESDRCGRYGLPHWAHRLTRDDTGAELRA